MPTPDANTAQSPTAPLDGAPALRLDAARLWPHVHPRYVLQRGPGWLALNKPVEMGETLPLGPGNAVRTRVSRAEGLPEPDLALLLPPVSGGTRPHVLHDARASGVCLVAHDAAAALAWRERATDLEQRWLVGVSGAPGPAAAAGFVAGLQALGVHVRARATRGARTLLEVRVVGLEPPDWLGELRRRGCVVAGRGRAPTAPAALGPSAGRGAGRRGAGRRGPPATAVRRDDDAGPLQAMVHRARVSWAGAVVDTPEPARLTRWLAGEPEPAAERLRDAVRRRYGLGHADHTDAFRLYDDERHMTLDVYGADLVLSSYDALPDPLADPVAGPDRLAAALAEAKASATQLGRLLGARSVWLKLRPKQANHIVDAARLGLAPGEPVMGQPLRPAGEAIVEEGGVRYWVRLGDGLSTGIFLDQRDNRAWIQRAAAGKRVLNTFSYTCGFSVAAAVGGAARTVSLDAAGPALERGRANLALNGHDAPETHDTLRGDVFAWLPRMARRGDRFDIIVLDPPSYAKVKKRRFSAAKDYAELVASALALLDSDGTLLCCINHAGVGRRRLEAMVRDGCRIAGRKVQSLHHVPPGVDHPAGRMKSLRIRVQ